MAFSLVLTYAFFGLAFMPFIIVLYLLGLSYGKYFKKFSCKIPAFKNFFVPLPYALIILGVSVITADSRLSVFVIWALFVYIRYFAAAAFYDLKDIDEDRQKGIVTLANSISLNKFKFILLAVNLGSLLPLIAGVFLGYFAWWILFFAIVLIIYAYLYIYRVQNYKDDTLKFVSLVVCDGEFLCWFPLLLLTKNLWT